MIDRNEPSDCNLDEIEQWLALIPDMLENLCENCRKEMTMQIVREVVIFGMDNGYEMLGALEIAKTDIQTLYKDEVEFDDEDENEK